MKKFITLSFIFITSLTFGQKIKKIIKQNDVTALEKYISKVDVIDDSVAYRVLFEGKYYVHPMVYAASENKIDIVKEFVKHKNKIIDYPTVLSQSFSVSISTQNDELINYLFELKPNLNQPCNQCSQNNPLMITVLYGNEKWYFKLKPTSNFNKVNDFGYNLLHLSAMNYNENIFKDLMSQNVDLNQISKGNNTPLQLSAMVGIEYMFFELINKKAITFSNQNLFADAIIGNNQKIFNYVAEKSFNPSFLWQKAEFIIPEFHDTSRYYPYQLALPDPIVKSSTLFNIVDELKSNYDKSESNNYNIFFWIIDEMMSDLNKNPKNSHIITMYEVLVGYETGYSSLRIAALLGDKKVYEKVFLTILEFNKRNYGPLSVYEEDNVEIEKEMIVEFTNSDYNIAKRHFGEDYVADLYKRLGVKF